MNYRDIKNKTNELLMIGDNLLKTFIFVSVLTGVLSYIGQIFSVRYYGIIALIISILTCTVRHAYIVSSLKQANGRGDAIDVIGDGTVGITRFFELFSTYFLLLLINFLIVFSCVFILIFMMMFLGVIQDVQQLSSLNAINTTIALITIVGVIVMLILVVYVNCTFMLAPYILEKYDIKGFNALKESARMMKGNKGTLIVLMLSYILRFLLALVLVVCSSIVLGIIAAVLPIIGTILANLVAIAILAYVFEMPVQVSLAIFYERIDYDDKNQVVNATMVE